MRLRLARPPSPKRYSLPLRWRAVGCAPRPLPMRVCRRDRPDSSRRSPVADRTRSRACRAACCRPSLDTALGLAVDENGLIRGRDSESRFGFQDRRVGDLHVEVVDKAFSISPCSTGSSYSLRHGMSPSDDVVSAPPRYTDGSAASGGADGVGATHDAMSCTMTRKCGPRTSRRSLMRAARFAASVGFLRLPRSISRWTSSYSDGVKNMPRHVAASIPAKTVEPSDCRDAAPAPCANINGMTPMMNASDVIRIGRKRRRAASVAASQSRRRGSAVRARTRRSARAFFAAKPMTKMMPICT